MTPDLPASFLDVPIAHRALHDVNEGRPQNSRSAVKAAIAAGYGIEIDVQLSADQQAIVFHDYDLERLSRGTGPVNAHSSAALSRMALRGCNEGIPTLNDILELVAGQVPLLIEIKDQDGNLGEDVGPLEAAVAASLADYSGPVAVMSFNPNSVMMMSGFLPEVPRGLVTDAFRPSDWELPAKTCERLRAILDVERTGSSFISHEFNDLARGRVAELKDQGVKILCWTIKSPEDEEKARRIAQNITFELYLAPLDA